MQYEIKGVDVTSGAERSLRVDVDTENDALAVAKTNGIFPYHVSILLYEPVLVSPARPIPTTSAASSDSKDAQRQLTGGRRCSGCSEPLRNVRFGSEPSGQNICVKCNPPHGKCPLCGSGLRTVAAEQCPECRASWHFRPGDGPNPSRARVQYRVSGAHRNSGKSCVLDIYATDEDTARNLADAQQIIISEIELIAIEEVAEEPRIRPAGRTSPSGRCPKCGSTNVTVHKKGFGLGKAAAGGLLLGPVGLLGGLVGSNKMKITCLKCGKVFNPGSR